MRRDKIALWVKIVLTSILITLLIPNEGKFKYEYQRGRAWDYPSLTAPFDIPLLKSQQEIREEGKSLSATTLPRYNLREVREWVDSSNQNLNNFIAKLYHEGVVDEYPDSSYKGAVIEVRDMGANLFLSVSNLKSGDEAYGAVVNFIASNKRDSLHLIERYFPSKRVEPNLIYDRGATEKALKEAIEAISPTKGMLFSGELIVGEGEIITSELEEILNSYRAEYEYSVGYSGSLFLINLGYFFLSLFLVTLLVVTLPLISEGFFSDVGATNFLLFLFLLLQLTATVVVNKGSSYLLIIPYSVVVLYLTSFFKNRVVLPIYMVILLPIIFTTSGGFEIYFMNLLAGTVALYTFKHWNRGWLQFVNSLFIFVTLSLTFVAFRLIEEGAFIIDNPQIFIYLLWNSLFVIAAYPFLSLFEKFFGLVSQSRLRDLSDATSPLLTSLAEEAPGTFQHSLQVANLAESAAKEIGANALLARVGALYHDIGKLTHPLYFIENFKEESVSGHIGLTTMESAEAIISHVDEGVALAKKKRIPQMVIEFILTHHGTSKALYFYNEYVNGGGDPDNLVPFTYRGRIPETKEEVVVMFADSLEAATRSLKEITEESVSALVEKIFAIKIEEKQLDNADISIKEVNIIKAHLKEKLLQTYHGRIEYPDRISTRR